MSDDDVTWPADMVVPQLDGVPEDDSAEPDDADTGHGASVEDVEAQA